MRIFVYEWVTGGGLLSGGGPLPESLLPEGLAMAHAVAADLDASAEHEGVFLRDLRVPQFDALSGTAETVDSSAAHGEAFDRLCRGCDAVLLIAPETDGELSRVVRRAVKTGARLLSPTIEVVDLASDKQATADRLRGAGAAVVEGVLIPPDGPLPRKVSYPAVVKPVDGAGSQDTYVVAGPDDHTPAGVAARRVEPFLPGLPVSVAVLAGPRDLVALPPCRQRLSQDGRLRYLGGSTPLAPGLAGRAERLATQAVAALPSPVGYLGVDLILSADPDGRGDRVIEVNPRLTTSYAALRFAIEENLAEQMIHAVRGEPVSVTAVGRPLEFGAEGVVSYVNAGEDPPSDVV